jgi:nucleoside-diphosphate-sugar epimerase
MTLSVYGGSGFVGNNFLRMFDGCTQIQREERKPLTKDILYFISTVDNYNVFDDLTLDVETNLKVLCEVLEHCKDKDITFNFISSWFVYGKTPYMGAKEDSVCMPTGFYSITKKCAEDLLISFCETFGVKYRILRLCNVMGAGDQKASRKKNAITWLIDELKLDHDINLYDGGSHCRDIMHVQDVCRAIKLVCDKGELNTIYNIGSGHPTKISEVVALAHHYLKSKSKINNIDPPEFHDQVQVQNFWMNTTKLQSLGFEPKLSLEFIVKDLCL